MADKDTITLKVAVDSKAAASGLKPLNDALKATTTQADKTEAELGKIGGDTAKIKVNDDAIEQAQKEIKRLRDQVRQDLSTDITADTKPALSRIGQLKRTIKALDDEHVEIKADVDLGAAGMRTELSNLGTAAANTSGPLGALLQSVGQARLVWGGIATVVGGAATGLVNFSADAETARLSIDTLTGSTEDGAKAFEELNRFATETPFEFDEITSAAQQLLAAGIDTGDLDKNLLAIGDAAAAVSAPIDEVALAYSQMVSKGKVSNEEMLQLQERAIDAQGILARAMGVTTAEVQKMASENKLGRDAVELLRKGMEETYGGAMQRQAKSLNGQLSTMSDNLKAVGKDFGDTIAPAVKTTVGLVSDLTVELDKLLDKRAEFKEADPGDDRGQSEFKKFWGGSLVSLDWIDDGVDKLKEFRDLITHGDPYFGEDKAKAAADHAERASKAKAEVARQARLQAKFERDVAENEQAAVKAAEEHAKQVAEATQELSRMADLYAGIGGSIRTKVSFIFSEADFNEEIDKLTGGKDGVALPAHLTLGGLGGLGEKQQSLVETISASVESGLQEGARRAELNPNFNEVAWYRQVREKTKGLLIKAGIDPKDINRVLTNVFGLPRTIPVDANLDPAQEAVNAFKPKPVELPIDPKILIKRPWANKPSNIEQLGLLDVNPVTEMPIAPKVDATASATARVELGDIAKPGGKARTGPVDAKVDQPAAHKANVRLDKLAEDRFSTIYVRIEKVGKAPVFGPVFEPTIAPSAALAPDARVALRGTAQALTAPAGVAPWFSPTATQTVQQGASGGGVAGGPSAPERLAPRQTPVAVYLDGQEISTSLELRARQLASVGTVRRRTA